MTHAMDTMNGRRLIDSDAPLVTWTWRSSVLASSPLARLGAGVSAVAAIASAVHPDVSLMAALPVAALVPAALVDVLDRRLPNRMVAVAALIGLVVAGATVLSGGDIGITGAVLGAAAFAGPLLLMHLIAPAAMGFGDVKVGVVLGAALGLIHPFYALAALTAGSFVGAMIGLATRRRTIPFGPALVGGATCALLLVASPVDVFDISRDDPAPAQQFPIPRFSEDASQ